MYRVIDKIFQYLDDNTLREAESFSAEWKQMFSAGKIWRKRFRDRVSCDYFDVITNYFNFNYYHLTSSKIGFTSGSFITRVEGHVGCY